MVVGRHHHRLLMRTEESIRGTADKGDMGVNRAGREDGSTRGCTTGKTTAGRKLGVGSFSGACSLDEMKFARLDVGDHMERDHDHGVVGVYLGNYRMLV